MVKMHPEVADVHALDAKIPIKVWKEEVRTAVEDAASVSTTSAPKLTILGWKQHKTPCISAPRCVRVIGEATTEAYRITE